MPSRKSNAARTPPQSLEAEQALLGSIMLRPEGMVDATDIVTPDSFYAEKHRIIYQAMLQLYAKNEPIDLVSLSAKLKEKKKLDAVGGSAYLAELVNTVPSAANLKYYAETVRKKSILRSLIEASFHIGEMGFSENEEVEDLLDTAEKQIFNITNAPLGKRYTSMKEGVHEAWERIEMLHNKKGELRGIPTGFQQFDNITAGLQKGDFIILAARPSMGKTALALDIARQAAVDHKIPVGIFSLEMSTHQLIDRMLAAQSRVDAWKLRTGRLDVEAEFSKIRDSLDHLSKAPIFIDDKAANTVLNMRATARRLKSEHGLGLLIVDYLQLVHPTKNYDSMVNQVTEISRSLKALAKELDVPVLALSQLSRAVESRGGRPRLSDLRDSGSIEQDADLVFFIHREDKQNEETARPNIAEILIEKHRNGPTGRVELYFDDRKTTFLSLDHQQAEESQTPADLSDF